MELEKEILRRISGTEDVEVASLFTFTVIRRAYTKGLFQVTPDVSENNRIGFCEGASQDLS